MSPRQWLTLPRRSVLGGLLAVVVPGLASGREPGSVFVENGEKRIRLGNDRIGVTVRRDTGGIEQVSALEHGTTLRESGGFAPTHWKVRFEDGTQRRTAASWFASPTTVGIAEGSQEALLQLGYTDPDLKDADGNVVGSFDGTITAEIRILADEPLARFHLAVDNNDDLAVRRLVTPSISNVAPLTQDGSGAIVMPKGVGRRVPDPVRNQIDATLEYPSKGGTMQWTAYVAKPVGFYADARDASGHVKGFGWGPQPGTDEQQLAFRTEYQHPSEPGTDVALPYETTLGILEGDWHDAADRYRAWIDDRGWLPEESTPTPGSLARRGAATHMTGYIRDVAQPDWQDDRTYDQAAAIVEGLAQRLETPMQFRWRGWATHGTPAGGDFFPPAEGETAFRDTTARLDTAGIGTTGYLNVTVGLPRSDWWTNDPAAARAGAATRRDGTLVTYSEPTGLEWVLMDATAASWRDHYRSALDRLVESGVTQLHLDGFPVRAGPDCYSDDHAHPPGRGGNWFAAEMRSLLADLAQNAVLGGEGIADCYLPHMSVHTTKDVRGPREQPPRQWPVEFVPLFPYTYGEFVTTEGWFDVPPRRDKSWFRNHLRIVVGRIVAWGALPDIRLRRPVSDPSIDDTMLDFLGRVARARARYANRFVVRGRMLRTPVIPSETVTIEVPAEEEGTVTERSPTTPASAWRSSRGEVGIFVTNVTGAARRAEIELEDQPFAVPSSPRVVYTVTNGSYQLHAGIGDELQSVGVEVAPETVTLLVVAEGTASAERALTAIIAAQGRSGSDGDQLATAKRAFEAGRYAAAVTAAEQVGPRTASNTSGSEPTRASMSTTPMGTASPRAKATTTETPGVSGLTAVTAAVGAVFAAALRRWRTRRES